MHEGFAMFWFAWGERQPTVAHDECGYAMPTGRGEQGVPKDLGVIVGMDIDKAGRNRAAIGVDHLTRIAADFPNRDDPTILDCNVSGVTIRAGTVYNATVFNQQVVTHGKPSFFAEK